MQVLKYLCNHWGILLLTCAGILLMNCCELRQGTQYNISEHVTAWVCYDRDHCMGSWLVPVTGQLLKRSTYWFHALRLLRT